MNFAKMTPAESRLFFSLVDGLSDMDYGHNPETGEWDVPMVEWSTAYGRYWARYESEEARTAAIEANDRDNAEYSHEWLREHRARVAAENKERGERARRLREAKTLGGQFPVLSELLVALRPAR